MTELSRRGNGSLTAATCKWSSCSVLIFSLLAVCCCNRRGAYTSARSLPVRASSGPGRQASSGFVLVRCGPGLCIHAVHILLHVVGPRVGFVLVHQIAFAWTAKSLFVRTQRPVAEPTAAPACSISHGLSLLHFGLWSADSRVSQKGISLSSGGTPSSSNAVPCWFT